ncbi:MAG: hypothetical protein NTY10_03020, partial [Candidatus Omnitrophica bacterium]|nr:hypothetical protein [Candidatus Omnitrophota bacterium]
PSDFDEREYFNARPHWTFVPVNLNLYPVFEEEILRETDAYRIRKTEEGIVQQEWKNKSCIPRFLEFTLKTARDWPEYKKRLQPHPDRIPSDISQHFKKAEESGLPIVFPSASLMGWIRDWMGIANMSYLMYDDLTCWAIDQVFPKMKTKPDMAFGWEDICGKNGPLVSPAIFKRYVAPGYRKIRGKLEEFGVELLGVDCDGDVAPLLGPWLDSGVNCQFPIEIGTWNADPMECRKKYGKELRIVGGFNKLMLEKGPMEIDAEIERRLPLIKEGGFVVMPDHGITPGTSLANYKYYLERIRNLRF